MHKKNIFSSFHMQKHAWKKRALLVSLHGESHDIIKINPYIHLNLLNISRIIAILKAFDEIYTFSKVEANQLKVK